MISGRAGCDLDEGLGVYAVDLMNHLALRLRA